MQEQSATFIGVNKYLEYVRHHHRSHNILLAVVFNVSVLVIWYVGWWLLKPQGQSGVWPDPRNIAFGSAAVPCKTQGGRPHIGLLLHFMRGDLSDAIHIAEASKKTLGMHTIASYPNLVSYYVKACLNSMKQAISSKEYGTLELNLMY